MGHHRHHHQKGVFFVSAKKKEVFKNFQERIGIVGMYKYVRCGAAQNSRRAKKKMKLSRTDMFALTVPVSLV